MSNKQNVFEQNKNMTKENRKFSGLSLFAVYFVIWLVAVLYFWIFMDPGDGIGYSLLVFYLALPLATFILSILIGKHDIWGGYKWFSAIYFGVMFMLAEYMTSSLGNMLAYQKINMPMFELFFIGAVISLIGLAIGTAIHVFQSKRNE
ncbi:MAG: hypothetical protein Q4P20_03250 [Eubacteriales bacterium]|nr:hypothetical protein [Eubacteriales bacterium]